MHKTIRDVLVAVPALTAIVPEPRWFRAGRVVDVPVKPFVVMRWLAPVTGNAANRQMRQLRVEAHDVRGDYKRIEALLGSEHLGTGVYGVLSGLAQHVGADGRITQCDFLGHSGDQEDVTYNTNMMFSSWRVIGVDL